MAHELRPSLRYRWNMWYAYLVGRRLWPWLERWRRWTEKDCGYGCAYVYPYGWVPEADCPVHDRA